jgi:uncharacterized membrane protein
MNYVPFVSAVPVVLIGVMQWLRPALVPPTIPFGVRVPRDHADAPVVLAQRRRYRLAIAALTVVATAAAVLAGNPAAGPVAVGAELLTGIPLYLHARARITAVKAEERWFAGRRQVTVADTSLRTDPPRYPWPWAVPTVVLTAATVLIGALDYSRMPASLAVHFGPSGRPDRWAARSFASAFGPVLAQVSATVLLLAVAGVALRSRAQLDAEDPQAATRHRRFVLAAARALLVLAGCTSLTFLANALDVWHLAVPPAPVRAMLNVVPTVLGGAVILVVIIRIGQSGSRIRLAGPAAGRGPTVNRDDDRLYRFGLFYFNPDDPSVFVPKRFGVGWTLNVARPVTWLIFGVVIAMGLIAPVVGAMTR